MYFKRKKLEKFRSFKGPLIDVRSPSEYYKGHMPNSINIPLFDNDERSIIGTIYKKEGRKKTSYISTDIAAANCCIIYLVVV